MPRIDIQHLQDVCRQVLRVAGVPEDEVVAVVDHLLQASLRGYDSHGVMRLGQYVREIQQGTIVPSSQWHVIDDWENGAVLDVKGLFGQVACRRAMQLALEKARRSTVSVVVLRHAGHSGRLGTYVEMAAEQAMIGLVTANGGGGGQWVAPFGGCERRLSTNPLAFGAPLGKDYPLVVDFSTSAAPEGKVRLYLQNGQEVPAGWLIGADGLPTRDPAQLYATPGAALLPFGNEVGHKAFGLALLVDVLAGALSDAGCPRNLGEGRSRDVLDGTGLCMTAIDIARFVALPKFLYHVGQMVDYIKSSSPAQGVRAVVVPGEYDDLQRRWREAEGIDLPDATWEELCRLAGCN